MGNDEPVGVGLAGGKTTVGEVRQRHVEPHGAEVNTTPVVTVAVLAPGFVEPLSGTKVRHLLA